MNLKQRIIELLLAIACRISDPESDVGACLDMSLADIRYWHRGGK